MGSVASKFHKLSFVHTPDILKYLFELWYFKNILLYSLLSLTRLGAVVVVEMAADVIFIGQHTVRYFLSHKVGIFLVLWYSASTIGQSCMNLHSPTWFVFSTTHALKRLWNWKLFRMESYSVNLLVALTRSRERIVIRRLNNKQLLFMMNTKIKLKILYRCEIVL